MPWQVRARLVDGRPCLQLLDDDGGHLRLAWRPPAGSGSDEALALRDLFRELFLRDLAQWAAGRRPEDGGALHHRRRPARSQG